MPAPLPPLEAAPDLADQVYRALLNTISTGALKPGQRVTQEELADQLAVSRQPVTQALKLLKKDGFVQSAPACAGSVGRCRSLQITPTDPFALAQIYEVLSALDVRAVRLAAGHRATIDPTLIERGRAAMAGDDIGAMIDADLAFHTALYRAAGNPLIEQSAPLHWHKFDAPWARHCSPASCASPSGTNTRPLRRRWRGAMRPPPGGSCRCMAATPARTWATRCWEASPPPKSYPPCVISWPAAALQRPGSVLS